MRAKTPKGDSKSKFGHNINSSLNLNKKKEDILNKIINKLEDIVSDYVAQKDAGKAIKQIKALVISLYKHIDKKHSQKEVNPMIPIITTISSNQDVNSEHLKEINKNDISHNSSVISDISSNSQLQKDTVSQNLKNTFLFHLLNHFSIHLCTHSHFYMSFYLFLLFFHFSFLLHIRFHFYACL